MIVVRLMGGIGNQMFQYAAGRALALHLNTELKCDDSYLKADPNEKYTQRHYELDGFKIHASLISKTELLKLDSKLTKAINRVLNKKSKVQNEQGNRFRPDFF